MKNNTEKSNKNTRIQRAGLDYANENEIKEIMDKTATMHRAPTGITLIALIITVIVLLILAGVALNFIIGENGILRHAEFASEKYENKAQIEQNELAQLDDYINSKEKNKIFAENVSFSPADTNWNVNNVKEALDYLYSH